MKNKFVIVGILVLAIGIGFISGLAVGRSRAERTKLKKITYEEYEQMKESGEKFIVDISRISCRYCAVVETDLADIIDGSIPVYLLDMELYHGRDEYEEIKGKLGITYVPTFFYLENGEVKYAMNAPLTDAYYDDDKTPDEKAEIRKESRSKMRAFIDGCIGKGPVVNETIQSDVVYEEKESEAND